jgi:hypothetical protein
MNLTMTWWERLNALCIRLGGRPGDEALDVIERAAIRLERGLSEKAILAEHVVEVFDPLKRGKTSPPADAQ